MSRDKLTIDKTKYCYIGACVSGAMEDISEGVLSFSIPGYGIHYRSRSEGDLIRLEFNAFFSLLEFLESRLTEENIKKVHVYSSVPEFVFSLAKNNSYFKSGSYPRKLLDEYNRKFKISVGYIQRSSNKALLPASLSASMPQGRSIDLKFEPGDLSFIDYNLF